MTKWKRQIHRHHRGRSGRNLQLTMRTTKVAGAANSHPALKNPGVKTSTGHQELSKPRLADGSHNTARKNGSSQDVDKRMHHDGSQKRLQQSTDLHRHSEPSNIKRALPERHHSSENPSGPSPGGYRSRGGPRPVRVNPDIHANYPSIKRELRTRKAPLPREST